LPHFLTYDLGIDKLSETWDLDLFFGLWKYTFEFSDTHYK
jgi:hypothetical protein